MSGRPRTTSFAEGNKQPNPVLGGVKISSKFFFIFNYLIDLNFFLYSYLLSYCTAE